jgi:hypothetical protein
MKKYNGTIGNRTRDLPAFSAVLHSVGISDGFNVKRYRELG